MPPESFVAWSGQPLDVLTDNVELVRRVWQRTEKGNILLASWTALHRGSIISQSGPEGKLIIPTEALAELSKIKEQYENALGCLVNFGIGETLTEAIKACAVSLEQGAGKTVIYAAWIEETADRESKQTDPLLKSAQPHKGKPAPALKESGAIPPIDTQTEQPPAPKMASEDEGDDQAWDPSLTGPDDIAKVLHSYAKPPTESEAPDLAALRNQTGGIIKQIKELVPDIEELRGKFPELYQGYLLLVHAFIELNKHGGETMQKNEPKDPENESDAELVEIPLEHFKSEDFAPEDDEKVKEYSKLNTEQPPVFMLDNRIVDGKKRLTAAKKQGKKTIKAYLGKSGFAIGRGLSNLPEGSTWQNRIKLIDPETGSPKWKLVSSGMTMSNKTGQPVSSTRPE